jgi:metallo-beta-lactamase family protein
VRITFYGGVGEVTGSRHLLEAEGLRVLLDCGLFQGHRAESIDKNKSCPFSPEKLDAVVLSHAHIDHSGGLPMLPAKGFKGPIHCTVPTLDLCSLMLLDSAHLQEEDAKFFNKLHAETGQTIQPLYGEADAKACLSRFTTHEYHETIALNGRVRAKLYNAGHVLGSAMIEMEVDTPKGPRRLLFTGDLGRRNTLLMRPPEKPTVVDYLLIESTYGDRIHESVDKVEGQLKAVIDRAVAEKGKVIIPSFALERTQEIVFILEKLLRHGQIPHVPIYVDSPMAVNITELFSKHIEGFSFAPEFQAYVAKEGNPFSFQAVRYVRTAEESKRLNDVPGPVVILSASGMCEGGRILHHLRNTIDKDTTTILLVGYQAQGTLGRRLQEGAKKVKIFGLPHEVWARVETMHSLSAHADRADLLDFIGGLNPRPRKIFLVHGDPADRVALAGHLKDIGITGVECPEMAQSFDLD